jgi:hypothetical protein
MAKKPVVVTLFAGKTETGALWAYADPDPAVVYVGDVVKWKVEASDGVKGVHPAHFRLKETAMDPAPFAHPIKRKRTRSGATEFTARSAKSGLIRIYKYDIMVGSRVAADPDVQIREK